MSARPARRLLPALPSVSALRLRATAVVVVTALLAAAAVLWTPSGAAQADEHVELSGETTPAVLAGDNASVHLVAASVSGADHYNVALRYELPVGVRYVGGSTAPATAGEPQVVTVVTVLDDDVVPPVTEQHEVLIWSNVADLRAGDDFDLDFEVSPDSALYPVGARFDGVASVYASADPRILPKFDATGEPLPAAGIASDEIETEPSAISAVSVEKDEPSPEAELMRGVHTQTTVYTLTVRNTTVAPTEDVVVVDYLPAGLEFLGCGGDDFSAAEEYPGSGPLDAPAVADCVTPDRVETVVDPAGIGTGVFTMVTWSLGTLGTDGAPVVLRYAAGIPLHANAAWTGEAPTPESLEQGSNLDNNTGPSTRQDGATRGLANSAVVTGDYTGPLAPGSESAVRHVDRETVEASDLSVVKSSSTGTFSSGQVAMFTLRLRAGEYASVSDMVITDVIPDGLCPLVPLGTTVIGTMPADCASAGPVVGADVESVTVETDGTFTVVLRPDAETLDANGTAEITYPALMRAVYGEVDAPPTVSGDSFRNTVRIAGTTTTVRDADDQPLQDPATRAVEDDSSAGLSSLPPTIDKRILPPTTAAACPETGYLEPSADALPRFGLGDRVCFELRVDFSAGTITRGAEVTDFLPPGTRYDAYTVVEGPGRVPAAQVVLTGGAALDAPTWAIGEVRDGGRFVAPGLELVLLVSAIVTDASSTSQVDITANLMKYRQESTAGRVLALRDQVDLGVAPPPVAAIAKHVVAGGTPVTSLQVGEGQTVGFRIDVGNLGTPVDGTDVPLVGIDVRDVLPAGFDCADVAASGVPISHAGVCTDSGGRGVIEWTLEGPIAPAAAHPPVTYSLVVPSPLSVSTSHVNTASIVGYEVVNTAGGRTPFTPSQPLEDTATLTLPGVAVDKTGVTGITETNNNAASQATQGERITYTYSVTVPARTSVLRGVLSDPLPSGLTVDASVPATAAYPAGVDPSDFTLSASGTLTFPDVWTNATDSPAVFTVTLTAVVGNAAVSSSTVNRDNTARFRSAAPAGAPAIADVTDGYRVNVRQATPSIAKTATPTSVGAGETIDFTIRAWTGSTRPPLHDALVVDCLPAGLEFLGYGVAGGAFADAAVDGDGANGCGIGTTRLAWNLDTLQPSNGTDAAARTLSYTARVSPDAAGAESYTNTATLRGTTIDGGGLALNAASNAIVNVNTATVAKSAEKPRATIGEDNTYTITVTLPAEVNFYDAAIVDALPAGVTLDGPATVECVDALGTACVLPGDGAALQVSGSKIGWALGDLLAAEQSRTVTVTVPVVVADIPATGIGTTISNTASLGWYVTDQVTGPADAGVTFPRSATGTPATFIATGPDLGVTKTVSDSTPGPGESFDYTVRVTNATGANISAAYDVTVVDTVPVGVVVDADSLVASGGVLTGAGTDGGGTVTWTLAGPIAPGATVQLGFTARLAASSAIDADPLVNSVDIPSYASLADGGRVYDDVTPATATVTPQFPRITLDKQAQSPDIAYRGEAFGWTLTLRNAGGAVAQTVTPVDLLPPNWQYVDGSARVSVGGTPAIAIDPDVTTDDADREQLTWDALGPLAPGASIVIGYRAVPLAAALQTPGVGATVPHVNALSATATDATDASANAAASYAPASAVTDTAVIHSADLTIVKTAGDTLVAGVTANAWRIVVSNAGPDPAVGTADVPFRVVDTPGTLPDGVTVVGASGSGWACTTPTTSGAFECTRTGSLASGSSFPAIVVAMRAAAGVPLATELENSASVTARTHDPAPENNSTEEIQVDTRADLAITKTANGAVRAGQAVSWTIGLTNLGPSVSRGAIEVTDTLPEGLTGVTAVGTGWECEVGASEVVCVRDADLAVGPAGAITVSGTLGSGVTGDVVNGAAITDRVTVDPVSANDSATASTAADTATTLALAKTLVGPLVDGVPTIEPGEVATYEFVVRTTGTADARTVVLSDPLPAGLELAAGTVVSVDGTWSCSGSTTVTCTLTGALAAGDSATVRFGVTVPSGLTGAVDNTATVSAANAAATTASALDPTTPRADFAITKTHPEGAVVAGTSVAYTLTATNLGPSDDPGAIRVVDTVPAGMTPTAASGTGWDCSIEGALVTCLLDAGLEALEAAPAIQVVAAVAPSAGPGTLVNAATVTGTLPSTDTSRASVTDPTVVSDDAVVSIVKSAVVGTVRAGEAATFTLDVTNAGPSDADALTVADVLPAGLVATALSGDGWSCTLETLVCARDTLAPGTTRITVVATVDAAVPHGSVLTNTATVGWRSGTEPRSDADDAAITVAAAADLALTKTADEPAVNAGETAGFTLTVENLGPSDAVGPLVVVDTLPVGLSYLGAGPGWSCDAVDPTEAGQTVTCTLAEDAGLAAGDDVELALTVQVDAAQAAGSLVNTASVSSATADPVETNDEDAASLAIGQLADLSIVKSHAETAQIGRTLDFVLAVRNDGPSAASDVTVVDVLPVGLTYVGAEGSDPAWSCLAASPGDAGTEVTCTLATPLGPDADAPALVLTTEVEAAAYPEVVNVAAVSSDVADADPTDDTASDTVAVTPLVDLTVEKSHVGEVRIGETARYEITVGNTGPTEEPGGFRIVDELPEGLEYVSAEGDDVACVAEAGVVECEFDGPLPVGGERTVTLVVRVLPSAPAEIVNVVVATSPYQLGTLAVTDDDTATVLAAHPLAMSGVTPTLMPAGILILAGLALLGAARWIAPRRRAGENGA